jgi:hypothetical protein
MKFSSKDERITSASFGVHDFPVKGETANKIVSEA